MSITKHGFVICKCSCFLFINSYTWIFFFFLNKIGQCAPWVNLEPVQCYMNLLFNSSSKCILIILKGCLKKALWLLINWYTVDSPLNCLVFLTCIWHMGRFWHYTRSLFGLYTLFHKALFIMSAVYDLLIFLFHSFETCR